MPIFICLCIDECLWTIPLRTGNNFTPCTGFTLNTLSEYKAVLFGGWALNDNGLEYPTNDIYFISFDHNVVVSYINASINFNFPTMHG